MTAPYIAELVARSKACLDINQLWALRVSLETDRWPMDSATLSVLSLRAIELRPADEFEEIDARDKARRDAYKRPKGCRACGFTGSIAETRFGYSLSRDRQVTTPCTCT
jgi:hypothetical protein